MTSRDSTGATRARRGGRPVLRRLLPTVAAAVVVAITVSLGQWQLRRADEKRAIQARVDAAAAADPVSIPPQPVPAASLDGRRVAVQGRWVPELTVFVDNRTYKGAAGFQVATPVKIESSRLHVLVLRGWVARDPRERDRLPAIETPAGVVRVEGLAQAEIAQVLELKASPPPGPEDRLWQNLDLPRFERWSGVALQPVLVRESAGSAGPDGLVRDWPVAGADVDKHIGYAMQWFGLAAATAGLWIYFSFIKRRDHHPDT